MSVVELSNLILFEREDKLSLVGCKILYSLTRYTLSANYFWMFLEGAHLFRLLGNAFVVPRTIRGYFFFGWLGPVVFVTIYIFLRVYHQHGDCWVRVFAGYEWWIYTPNLLILLCNTLFLGWIVVCLTRQLQVHPNEPSCYRRALKAMAVLTPLFGLQMLVFLYRPPGNINSTYEICAAVCKSSQGSVVALIFCYLNKEVRSQITLRLRSIKQGSWWTDRLPRTLNTRTSRRHSQGVLNKKSDQSFIELTVQPRSKCRYNTVSQEPVPSLTPSRNTTVGV
ncbi:hypothetical protein RRG08_022449 [Elysia crispata]|uniref:G-protein coupled receptors family 2 profile 2 domain-containing protein n=1 Tax=Elysia crispata TaxID=231223 RepID=A0AAE0Z1F0_9GAST|nr:hypothetical protein RRG08_022449 [Elysia crispata]